MTFTTETQRSPRLKKRFSFTFAMVSVRSVPLWFIFLGALSIHVFTPFVGLSAERTSSGAHGCLRVPCGDGLARGFLGLLSLEGITDRAGKLVGARFILFEQSNVVLADMKLSLADIPSVLANRIVRINFEFVR